MLTRTHHVSDDNIVADMAANGLRKLAAHPVIRAKFSSDKVIQTILAAPANRYILGKTIEEVGPKLETLFAKGYRIGIEYVGEEITIPEQINAVVDEYLHVLKASRGKSFAAALQIGFDLSNVGLLVSRDLAITNTRKIAQAAADQNCSLIISMERSTLIDQILDIFIELAPNYPNLGLTVQAQLNRTEADLEKLLKLGRKIRLVKGVYNEHESISLRRSQALNDRYIALAGRMASEKVPFAIATHDPLLVEQLENQGILESADELESLHGCNPELLRNRNAAGFPCRLSSVYGEEWLLHVLHRLAEHTPNVLTALADYYDPSRVAFGSNY